MIMHSERLTLRSSTRYYLLSRQLTTFLHVSISETLRCNIEENELCKGLLHSSDVRHVQIVVRSKCTAMQHQRKVHTWHDATTPYLQEDNWSSPGACVFDRVLCRRQMSKFQLPHFQTRL